MLKSLTRGCRLTVHKSVPAVRIHLAPPTSQCEPIPVVASFRGLNENRVIGKVHARTPDHADKSRRNPRDDFPNGNKAAVGCIALFAPVFHSGPRSTRLRPSPTFTRQRKALVFWPKTVRAVLTTSTPMSTRLRQRHPELHREMAGRGDIGDVAQGPVRSSSREHRWDRARVAETRQASLCSSSRTTDP